VKKKNGEKEPRRKMTPQKHKEGVRHSNFFVWHQGKTTGIREKKGESNPTQPKEKVRPSTKPLKEITRSLLQRFPLPEIAPANPKWKKLGLSKKNELNVAPPKPKSLGVLKKRRAIGPQFLNTLG